MAESHLHALPSGYEIEGYRIERILGAGGFGITYRAEEMLIHRPVALKEYMPSSVAGRSSSSAAVLPLNAEDSEIYRWGLKRFRNEARTLVAFRHPNIVAVYRYFEANGTAYLVMALEEGMTLAAMLKQGEPLSESDIHEILDPLLDGVDEVHKAGFLHRDIKPANIVIRRDGAPVLIDFGAARLALGTKSQGSRAVLSPGYAPFEQYATAAEQGPYTDIYALGATLYACVTGQRPVEAPDRVARVPMRPAAEAGRGRFSEMFLRAIDHALEVKSEDRPQSVTEWRGELAGRAKAVAQPEPVTAPPPPRAAVSLSRRRGVRVAVMALVGLLVAAGAYGGIDYYNAERERALLAAEQERQRVADAEKERQRLDDARRAEAEKAQKSRDAEKRQRAESAAARARRVQAAALASMRLALTARQQAFTAADCGRKAAERARSGENGHYSGKLTNGNQYDGKLNAAKRADGCGVLVDTIGKRWEGNFKDGLSHGHATFIGADGTRYEGAFQNGNPEGHGVLRFSNGNEMLGALKASVYVNPYVWAETNGARYEGEFKQDRWSGYGVLRHADGRVFEGEFDDGRAHGQGVMSGADGSKTHGRWEKGEYKGLE